MPSDKNEVMRYEVVVRKKNRKIPVCPTCRQYVGDEIILFDNREVRYLDISDVRCIISRQLYPKLFKKD